jgi:hypothetical protein
MKNIIFLLSFGLLFVFITLTIPACETKSIEKEDTILIKTKELFFQTFLPDVTMLMDPQTLTDPTTEAEVRQKIVDGIDLQRKRILYAMYAYIPFYQQSFRSRLFYVKAHQIFTILGKVFNKILVDVESLATVSTKNEKADSDQDQSSDASAEANDFKKTLSIDTLKKRLTDLFRCVRFVYYGKLEDTPSSFQTWYGKINDIIPVQTIAQLNRRLGLLSDEEIQEKCLTITDNLTALESELYGMGEQQIDEMGWSFWEYLITRIELTKESVEKLTFTIDLISTREPTKQTLTIRNEYSIEYQFTIIVMIMVNQRWGTYNPISNTLIPEDDPMWETLAELEYHFDKLYNEVISNVRNYLPPNLSELDIRNLSTFVKFTAEEGMFKEMAKRIQLPEGISPLERLKTTTTPINISWLKTFLTIDDEFRETEESFGLYVNYLIESLSYLDMYKNILLHKEKFTSEEYMKYLQWFWFKFLNARDL